MFNHTMVHRTLFQSHQLESSITPTRHSSLVKDRNSLIKNNIHKVNKMGHPHKNLQSVSSEFVENGYIYIELMREKQKRKSRSDKNDIYSFFPTYTTLLDVQPQKQQVLTYTMNLSKQRNKNKKRTLSIPKQKNQEDYTLSVEKRRLIPIKKYTPVQKRIYRPQPNVTFLNVEKVSLLPINKDSQTQQITKGFDDRTGSNYQKINFGQTADAPLSQRHKSFFEQSPLIQKNKAFVPPVERYYYYDFIWKVAYSNGMKAQFPETLKKKYKIYIGYGNNSMLIKTFFKRRQCWWAFTQRIEEANFIWTQIKVHHIHEKQKKCINNKSPPPPQQSPKKNHMRRRNAKILNSNDLETWCNYFENCRSIQQKINPSFSKRNRFFKDKVMMEQSYDIKMHNHFPRNYVLGNKKALFSTMKKYYEATKQDIFQFLPLTFHIEYGLQDPEYLKFLNYYYKKNKAHKQNTNGQKVKQINNIWIVKPGEFSNRGNGIIVCQTLDQIKAIVKQKKKHENGNWKTYIIQEYLDKPMLYYRRKFDIRHFMLITCINGYKKGYWYKDGYLRTTSYEYSTKNCFGSVHLTNDAIQKNLPDYGKYEKANKLSYEEFQKYLQKQYKGRFSFFETIYPQMKKIANDSMKASSMIMDENSKAHNFEIFGFDFMIDQNFHPWLIEINTNPCLEISCPVLMDIIAPMIQNALKISIDSVFLPPSTFTEKRPRFSSNIIQENKFQLLYDSFHEQQALKKLFENDGQVKLNFKELEKDEDEIFEDDGVELDD